MSVSSVITPQMVRSGDVEDLIDFLESLNVDEAWLSEVKPSVEEYQDDNLLLSEEGRRQLVTLQDRYNRRGGMTVNYLGHFEGAETFGCNAGCKMVYVDAFGEVSPCVFLPMSFGNVRERPLTEIVEEMRSVFPGEEGCFINRHYKLMREIAGGDRMLDRSRSLELLRRVTFGPASTFNRRLRGTDATGRVSHVAEAA